MKNYDFSEPTTYTTSPIYVGSTVLGVKFNNGVVIATDTRLNYGSLAKFYNVNDRVQKLNNNTIIGSSGEYSDFQEILRILQEEALNDYLQNNNSESSRSYLGPSEMVNYLATMSYYKRNKMNPYWNSTIIGGIGWDGEPTLKSVDQFGTLLEGNYIVTGFGIYFSNAILEPNCSGDYRDMTKERAIELLEYSFRVLFYRDAKAGNHLKFGVMEKKDDFIDYFEFEKTISSVWNHDQFLKSGNEKFYMGYEKSRSEKSKNLST